MRRTPYTGGYPPSATLGLHHKRLLPPFLKEKVGPDLSFNQLRCTHDLRGHTRSWIQGRFGQLLTTLLPYLLPRESHGSVLQVHSSEQASHRACMPKNSVFVCLIGTCIRLLLAVSRACPYRNKTERAQCRDALHPSATELLYKAPHSACSHASLQQPYTWFLHEANQANYFFS